MSDLRTTAAWRALQAQRLQRLHPQQPAPLTAGEALALLEDVQLAEQALADCQREFRRHLDIDNDESHERAYVFLNGAPR